MQTLEFFAHAPQQFRAQALLRVGDAKDAAFDFGEVLEAIAGVE
ncbi:hypothetical protein [Azotobacter beijerinckii]|nr:hypothetical protein [Azotobacter beijerinckii]MDV7213455.1 hypothetical protein [Azotobacter beijerinckii]